MNIKYKVYFPAIKGRYGFSKTFNKKSDANKAWKDYLKFKRAK